MQRLLHPLEGSYIWVVPILKILQWRSKDNEYQEALEEEKKKEKEAKKLAVIWFGDNYA